MNDNVHPFDENGDEKPHEIESIELRIQHVDREVKVEEPEKPAWIGRISGWDPEGILVRPARSGTPQRVLAEHLKWEV